MTHNIQIGVNVDDEAIVNGVKAEALHQIERALFGKIIDTSRYYYGRDYRFTDDFKRDYLDEMFEKIFNDKDFRQLLVDTTADALVERLMKSTAFKQRIADKINDD